MHRFIGEVGVGKIGAGDHLIPSGRLGYAHQILPHVDVVTDMRFSFIETYGSRFPLSRGSFSYLDGTVAAVLHPIDTEHHRLDIGLGAALRGRWETRATRGRVHRGPEGEVREIVYINYERRSSVDVGYLLRAGYSYKLFSSLRLGAQMHGYTYREGTSLFLFGLTVDYLP